MDTEYIPSNNIKITYQNGLNGAKRSIIIPQWSIFTLGTLLVFLFVSTFIFYAMLGNYAKLGDKVEQYKAENNSLRSKVDFYSAAVDSIYKMLEAPALKGSSADADYPSLGLGNSRQYSDFSNDPALKNQIDQLELKLAAILAQVNVSEPNPINHLPETPNAIYPADSMPSIYPSFGRISDGWGMR
ncbi:MAG: peptidase M23, partial [Candidatus Cloacimonetes bacterium]|nr:peptidase M23 [Candidatus Cloacimonadota bacterium]